ncbi:putative box C/D snoRNA protein [Carex littledalei]|uniref:Box C/D snoRNA protein 1 n=1 Tax=Carex littledalei TaxID=544730 RepID=A0A833VQF9_9POAL|nr:putative box C/D snoRNA protein [Carex littledalei]
MADFQSPSNPNPVSKKSDLCEECGENKWKYRCPGCGLLSCSLPCVKSHKERLQCTGKRPRTDFIPISQFDDKALLSDYNFLEETKQVAEAARRIISGFGASYAGCFLPHRLHILKKAAFKRGTCLYFLPKGMSKRESNQSHFDRRRDCIYWTIEWRLHSVHSTLIDHDVPETERLERLIEKHLSPTPWNDNLTSYRKVPLSDLRFFVQKHAKTSKSSFRELDIKLPMCSQLRNVLILEHPVMHVYLPTETPDFNIEKRVMPKNTKGRDVCSSNQDSNLLSGEPAAKCSIYKEEEIEEGETEPETQVVDLSEHVAQDSKFGRGAGMRKCSTVASPAKKASQSRNSTEGMIQGEAQGLDFDQEVERAYSDLIGGIDPDDFLCFDDDGFINSVHNCENKALGSGEEVEEGEIPA